jgi:hypothetical protein
MMASWLWLLLAFLPLLFLERWIHRHLQGVWLLLFRSEELALIVYSLILLPGVFLHEASHWLMATLLGVRAVGFSLVPTTMPDGTLRLGYVETERMDFVRETLVGAAPLIVGTGVVLWISYGRLNLGPVAVALGQGDVLALWQAWQAVMLAPDAGLWLYLTFAVSNSMLPSASDRRAWPVLALAVALVGGLLFYAGFGPSLINALAQPVDAALRALAFAFSVTVGLNLLLMPFVWAAETFLTRLTGQVINYQ